MTVVHKVRERGLGKANQDASWLDLRQAFQAINSEKEFAPMISAVLRYACRLFQADGAALLLANKQNGSLEMAAIENLSEDAVSRYRTEPARTQSLELGGTESGYGLIRNLAEGFAQHMIQPIQLQNKIIGALVLASMRLSENTRERQERLDVFLEYIAQAIENAYLIFQLRQQNGHLEAMMTRLQNTQDHLKRAEKMALVGKIATAVAHEMRNPLTIIGTTLQLVYEKMSVDNSERDLYSGMISKVRAVDQTIKELMTFARPVQIHPQPLCLDAVIAKVVTFISKKYAHHRLELRVEVAHDLPQVFLDEEQLQRILINLFLNAYNFLPEGGCVTVQARYIEKTAWLELVFSDNGPGVSPQHAPQIFEPFFSTRVDGTGLGLFLVKYLLEEMQGSIELNQVAPEGAEFHLRLPIVA